MKYATKKTAQKMKATLFDKILQHYFPSDDCMAKVVFMQGVIKSVFIFRYNIYIGAIVNANNRGWIANTFGDCGSDSVGFEDAVKIIYQNNIKP